MHLSQLCALSLAALIETMLVSSGLSMCCQQLLAIPEPVPFRF